MTNQKSKPSPPTNLTPEQAEANLQAALLQARTTIGNTAPRLLTEKPQVAANSLRHGLTGQSVFLTPMEMRDYLTLGRDIIEELRPISAIETLHAQRIIDTEWRLNVAVALTNIMQTSATILESQAIYAANPHLANVKSDSVAAEIVQVHAQAAAVRKQCEGANTMEKLGRHETRLYRALRTMRKDYKEMRLLHHLELADWVQLKCPGHIWYKEVAELADQLLAARNQIVADTEVEIIPIDTEGNPVSPEDLIRTAEGDLLCKKVIRILRPLTPPNLRAFRLGGLAGMLTELEDTLFPLSGAA